jgi:hypothetical protein
MFGEIFLEHGNDFFGGEHCCFLFILGRHYSDSGLRTAGVIGMFSRFS